MDNLSDFDDFDELHLFTMMNYDVIYRDIR